MRWFSFGWFATLLSVVVLLGSVSDSHGKGKGRGGGSKHKRAHVLRAPSHHGPQHSQQHATGTCWQKLHSPAPTDRNGSLARQRTNEQRKLDHRLSQADHLRDIAERNGNEKLLDAADRMELAAHEHYQKRMAKIDEKAGDKGLPASDDVADDVDDVDDDAMDDDAGRMGSLPGEARHAKRQALQNEERILTQRLEQADHLRSIAERNGNERLLKVADRMEENALDHYTSRLDAIERQFDSTRPDRRVRQPVIDAAVDRLHTPARSYVRGLLRP
jgi:hypothetical protein